MKICTQEAADFELNECHVINNENLYTAADFELNECHVINNENLYTGGSRF